MSDANQNIELGAAEGTDAGLGDAEENLLWKPQNIQVLVRIISCVQPDLFGLLVGQTSGCTQLMICGQYLQVLVVHVACLFMGKCLLCLQGRLVSSLQSLMLIP